MFNADKTCCVLFQSNSLRLSSIPNIYLNGSVLKFVDSFKYLGVFLCASGKDNEDIQRQIRAFYIQANTLMRKFYNCSYHVKIMLFNSYCSTMYCSPMWTIFNKSSIDKLRIGYNNAFRRLFGYARDCSASNMFVSNRVNTFDSLWRKQIFSCRSRLETSLNSLVKCIHNSDVYYLSLIQKHWRQLLY